MLLTAESRRRQRGPKSLTTEIGPWVVRGMLGLSLFNFREFFAAASLTFLHVSRIYEHLRGICTMHNLSSGSMRADAGQGADRLRVKDEVSGLRAGRRG